MMGGTHLAAASLTYLGGAIVLEIPLHVHHWMGCIAASLLPDLDLSRSWAGRCLPPIARWLESRYPHRTLTHSICGCSGFALVCTPLLLDSRDTYLAVVGGYVSHLLLDMFNPRGIDLFWPSQTAWVMLADAREKLPSTGSREERLILSLLLLLHPVAYPMADTGLRHTIQYWLRDFSVSTEVYANSPRNHWQYLELEATDNLSHDRRQCTCLILARWHDGLLLEYQHQAVTVGRGGDLYQWFPHQARLVEGDGLRIASGLVNMQGHTLGALSRAWRNPSSTIFLSGSLQLVSRSHQPPISSHEYRPVWQQDNMLHITMARPEALDAWTDIRITGGSLRIDAWLHPGEAAVTVATEDTASPDDRLSTLMSLRRREQVR